MMMLITVSTCTEKQAGQGLYSFRGHRINDHMIYRFIRPKVERSSSAPGAAVWPHIAPSSVFQELLLLLLMSMNR